MRHFTPCDLTVTALLLDGDNPRAQTSAPSHHCRVGRMNRNGLLSFQNHHSVVCEEESSSDPAFRTVLQVILSPGVSPATNGPASQDAPQQTEEHRAGSWGEG